MLTPRTLKGNWGTLLLPVDAEDRIDYDLLQEEIGRLIAAGIDGIYSNGTAGELHNQTEAEFDRVQALLSEKCRQASLPFQIGASNSSPLVTLERIRRCVALEPHAFQVILPDWVPATADEQLFFLERIVRAADGIPLVLYNPPHAKTRLAPEDFGRLGQEFPQLIGIKVAMGDAVWVRDMKEHAAGLSVFVPGHFLASGYRDGLASGAYSNVACLSPRGAQDWWLQMQHDLPGALDLERRLLLFLEECVTPYQRAGYSNPALDKFLAAVGGWGPVGTRLRWPYKWIGEEDVAPARARAAALLPEFFREG